MRKAFDDVMEFHEKFCPHLIGTTPKSPNGSTIDLRVNLILEEVDELEHAMNIRDLPEIADAMADLIYVVIGAAITYGIDLPAVWDEVQRTNMLKEGGPTRPDGKVLKPKGWLPPDVKGILKSQESIKKLS